MCARATTKGVNGLAGRMERLRAPNLVHKIFHILIDSVPISVINAHTSCAYRAVSSLFPRCSLGAPAKEKWGKIMMRGNLQSLKICGLFLFLLAWAQCAGAQATTGSIYGQILDPAKAAVVGAKVVATDQSTGVAYTSQSDSQGNFVVLNIPPATYTLSVAKTGFETATIKDVLLAVDQKQLLNFDLTIGSMSETVTVSSAPTMLQTESGATGEVIQSQDILNLPLLGSPNRDFYSLAGLTAGVLPATGNTNSFNFAVNGQREYSNSVLVDGVETTTNRTQDITLTPSVDAVQEFKVLTSAYSAQYGRAAGGVISVDTKSGSNGFHGDAYIFNRPNFADADQYSFGAPGKGSELKQNNYGGTLGGPIKKNKSFFFASYEQYRKSDPYVSINSVPPVNQIQFMPNGDINFSNMLDPGSPANPTSSNPAIFIKLFDPNVSAACFGGCATAFANDTIPANRVSKAGLNTLLNFFPTPNLTGVDNGWYRNFQGDSPTKTTGRNADGRFDQNISSNDRLSVIYHYNDTSIFDSSPFVGATVVPNGADNDFGNDEYVRSQGISVAETHLFSDRFINDFRFGYTRYTQVQTSLMNGNDYSTKYGVGNIAVPGYPATDAYPYIELGAGYFTGGSTYKPFHIADRNYQFEDNLIVSGLGRHEVHFGGDFRLLNSHPNFSLFPTGFQYYCSFYCALTGDPTFGYFNPNAFYGNGGTDIADLLLGLPFDTYIGLQLTNPHTKTWEMAYYVEDTFKVSPKFTLTYGIRYEFQAPYTEANNNESNYNVATDSFLLAGRGSNPAGLMNSRWNDFAPRIGLAYQLNSKTVIRGGYGLFYSPENDGREDFLTKNYPFADQAAYFDSVYNGLPFPYILDNGIPRNTTINIPAGASSIPTSSIANGNLETTYYVDPNMRTGYSQLYNVTLQRALGTSFTVEAGYVGSVSHDLSYEIGNINSATPPVTPNLGIIQELKTAGWGAYNSFQLKATKRASKNLSFLAAYTYGHNLDNGPSPFNLVGGYNTPQNPFDLQAEVASADDDVRHAFNLSGLYRLPIGQGQRFFSNWGATPEFLFGGWQINGIFVGRSGTPINIVRDGSNAVCSGARPNLVGDPNLPAGQRNYLEWFNKSAFSAIGLSGTCQPGNAGRNLVTGPRFFNTDFSVFKEFGFKERYTVQTRVETFNLFNHPNFGGPGTDLSQGGSFGYISTINGNMRIMQFAVKFLF